MSHHATPQQVHTVRAQVTCFLSAMLSHSLTMPSSDSLGPWDGGGDQTVGGRVARKKESQSVSPSPQMYIYVPLTITINPALPLLLQTPFTCLPPARLLRAPGHNPSDEQAGEDPALDPGKGLYYRRGSGIRAIFRAK